MNLERIFESVLSESIPKGMKGRKYKLDQNRQAPPREVREKMAIEAAQKIVNKNPNIDEYDLVDILEMGYGVNNKYVADSDFMKMGCVPNFYEIAENALRKARGEEEIKPDPEKQAVMDFWTNAHR